jgi:minor extracellular serine protease Vpr
MQSTRKLLSISVILIFSCLLLLFPLRAKMQVTDGTNESTSVPVDTNNVPKDNNETSSKVLILLSGASLSEGGTRANLRQQLNVFNDEVRKAGIKVKIKKHLNILVNAISAEVRKDEVNNLLSLSNVEAVFPNLTFKIDPIKSSINPDLATAVAMTGADIAQNSLGLTGEGIKVGIIDTGVDYHHPDLGGCFGPGCRVVTGYDFVGDDFGSSGNVEPKPDNDPDDCGGHGTHVAGIVGANGKVKGVAPSVTFGAYKVFGCEGTTNADIIIAAMERAYTDGMQVINMSIGASYQWPQYPTAVAADRLVQKGIAVVTSIGNSGTNGAYAAGAPGVGKHVIGVASVDNTHQMYRIFTISPDNRGISFIEATGAPTAPALGTLPIKKTGTPTIADDACNPLPAGTLTGHAALIRRGTCSFYTKAINAQNAGAAAVIIYNNAAGRIAPTVQAPEGQPSITIPTVSILAEDGILISNRLDTEPVTLTWTDLTKPFVNPTGGLISSFSSYGLAPDLSLKPDISAPGGSIYSIVPLEQGGYETLSGTSMSSPHVAGAVALLLEARPRTRAMDVRDILQNTAKPTVWSLTPQLGLLDNVNRQGAGLLDIVGAIQSTTRITPAKLSLGESENGPSVQRLTIRNSSNAPVIYKLSHTPAVSTVNTFPGPTNGTFQPLTFDDNFADVKFSPETIVVPARGMARVTVTITANNEAPDHTLYGGYIEFTPQGEGQVYRVPYAGFKGDYQSIQVLRPTPYGFPWLAKLSGDSFSKQPEGATYTLQNGDIPYILVHVNHQSRRLVMDVRNVDTGKYVDPIFHTAFDGEYIGRSSTPTHFYALSWDGTLLNSFLRSDVLEKIPFKVPEEWLSKQVPNGRYVIEITVLKALGDPRNPAHKETWTSPVITIQRP